MESMTPEEKRAKQREYQCKYRHSQQGKLKARQWEKENTDRRREYKRIKQQEYRQRKALG